MDYFNIHGASSGRISEGEGLNYVIFFQGCPRGCIGCHNVFANPLRPQGLWKIERIFQCIKDSIYYDSREKDFDTFMEKAWLIYLESQLMEMRKLSLLKSPFPEVSYSTFIHAYHLKALLFHRFLFGFSNDSLIDSIIHQTKIDRRSTRVRLTGVTFGGGEPMIQAKNLTILTKRIKEELKLEIWVYTGFLFDDLYQYPEPREVLNNIDFLIDGSFIKEKLNLAHPFYGSTNQNIIDIQKTIREKKKILWQPRYKWSQVFIPYWNKYKDIKKVEKYTIFKSKKDMELYLRYESKLKYKINIIKEYERIFGSIRENFLKNVLDN